MNLGKAYNSSELENLLDARCSINTDLKLDTISTLSKPVHGSLGFITKMGDYDTSKFRALIVDNSCSDDQFDKIVLFKTKNVMRSVSLLLKDVSKNQGYTLSEEYPNVTIGENVKIGKNCYIYPGVFINHNTEIGDNVIIHPNAVIGSDGFGLYLDQKIWHKIPHIGKVIIEDNVEIGSCTTVDRGMIDETSLKTNCKIDNLVHIAHNVTIGRNTAIAACTGIAGSSTIGDNCTIGGGVGINGHISVCDNVHIHGMSMITKSIKSEGEYASAMAADTVRNWRKNQVLFRNLYKKNR
jgi:serine acetyltransferase